MKPIACHRQAFPFAPNTHKSVSFIDPIGFKVTMENSCTKAKNRIPSHHFLIFSTLGLKLLIFLL